MTGNICYRQSRYNAIFADAKIVDVSTLATLATSGRIDRTDDVSGRNLRISTTDTSPEFLALEPAMCVSNWER